MSDISIYFYECCYFVTILKGPKQNSVKLINDYIGYILGKKKEKRTIKYIVLYDYTLLYFVTSDFWSKINLIDYSINNCFFLRQ